jgi:UDP-N-acetylmuramoyl-tripeptide--D-alanyl-D-alanine ligase
MNIKELYTLYKQNYRVTTDTRLNLKNSIFFALKGDNFNGNKYANVALKKGAKYAVVDEKKYQTNKKIILVKDVLQTLQDLAKFHRQSLNIPIISLTGSNGKTTTKELIHAVLNEKYRCVATKGNLNNHIGVPLTLLSMQPDTEIAVIEMGANHHKEIKMLCEIALPDFGYITNFGKVHLEGFGSLEGVIKGKTEMYDHLKKNDKIVFVNTNDNIQVQHAVGIKKITFGSLNSDLPIEFVEANPFVKSIFNKIELQSKLIGKYNYSNIASAIAIGKYFKVADEQIKKGIENYTPSNNRSEIIYKNSNKIILDAYNANPNSMEATLENLSQLTDKNKIAILGDMFEIGENALQEHQQIVDLIERSDFDKCILIGEIFSKTKIVDKRIVQFKTFDEFKNESDKIQIKNTTILIKASRGMALERVLDII